MKIEEPNFRTMTTTMLFKWFNENVEPINKILAAGVEVYTVADSDSEPRDHNYWGKKDDGKSMYRDSHKALLINIEQIKQETREEKLAKMLDFFVSFSPDSAPYKAAKIEAKKLLEETT